MVEVLSVDYSSVQWMETQVVMSCVDRNLDVNVGLGHWCEFVSLSLCGRTFRKTYYGAPQNILNVNLTMSLVPAHRLTRG